MAHTTKSDGDKEAGRTLEKVRIREEAAARCTKVIKIRVFRNQKQGKPGRSYCEVQHDARNDDAEKEVFDGIVSQWQIQEHCAEV